MKSKNPRARPTKATATPDENDFAGLDHWARNLRLEDGRPLTPDERREEGLARKAGRPAKAKRVMVSMAPSLIEAAGNYAKTSGRTLSGLIAESLAEKIKRESSKVAR